MSEISHSYHTLCDLCISAHFPRIMNTLYAVLLFQNVVWDHQIFLEYLNTPLIIFQFTFINLCENNIMLVEIEYLDIDSFQYD